MNGYDQATSDWFLRNPFAETTVMQCEKCGLFFKPSLGHRCRKDKDYEQKGKTKAGKARHPGKKRTNPECEGI